MYHRCMLFGRARHHTTHAAKQAKPTQVKRRFTGGPCGPCGFGGGAGRARSAAQPT
jgi:hypothetical protein